MKHKVVLILFCALTAVMPLMLLAGCGEDAASSETTTTKAATTAQPTTAKSTVPKTTAPLLHLMSRMCKTTTRNIKTIHLQKDIMQNRKIIILMFHTTRTSTMKMRTLMNLRRNPVKQVKTITTTIITLKFRAKVKLLSMVILIM